MVRVLVTDGAQRSSLAAVRSLGRAGYTVFVGSGSQKDLAAISRWNSEFVRLPDPLLEPDEYVSAIAAACDAQAIDVLLPMTDASAALILEHRSRFGNVRIPMGSFAAFTEMSNKESAARAAAELGIAVPKQQIARSRDEALRLMNSVRFPAVLKPAFSVAGTREARTKHPVVHAADATAYTSAVNRLAPSAYPLLIQERIIGPGVGVFLLIWGGKVVASFAHRRIREKPPAGGVSVLAESISIDTRMLELSRDLVRRFGWEGVAMVEYKIRTDTQEPVLMEINGRFWGTLQLAIDAGVDFPRLLVSLSLGQSPPPVNEWKVGVRSRWFWGDIDHAIAVLRQSRARLHLAPDAPGKVRTLWSICASSFQPSGDQVFRLLDPAPALAELIARLRPAPKGNRSG
jgi:predicted ATP-grasp superfamily ATP-dependent carboligase